MGEVALLWPMICFQMHLLEHTWLLQAPFCEYRSSTQRRSRLHCILSSCTCFRSWIDFAVHVIVASSLTFVDIWRKAATSTHNSQRMKARPASCVPRCVGNLTSSYFYLTIALISGLVTPPIEQLRTMQPRARRMTRVRLLRSL